MTAVTVGVEPLSDEVLAAYASSGMERGRSGVEALNWAFGSNPTPFAVARQDGHIVGLSAYIRTHMQFGSRSGYGLQAVDSFVSEKMRGKGIFTQLARAYDEHAATSGASLVWGFPNDNAAPAWFGKLGWQSHGQVPFLVKPLRAGYFLRKLGLGKDFPVSFAKDQNLPQIRAIGEWGDALWETVAGQVKCATIRNQNYLQHRLFSAPQSADYRVVAASNSTTPAIVATREASKHGGRIGYLMEALGGPDLNELLMSEIGRMKNRGVELVLAWSFPWSPNYRDLRRAGFFPLPERLRPIRIWFGSRPKLTTAMVANDVAQWYLSYLDSDTI